MAEIQLDSLTKVYPDGTKAVTDLDLEVGAGEFVVFVGPSGCGKTTALRMIAGLEEITDGTVRIGGEVVNDLPPKDRDIAMIFQNYALYPHMSAFDNMAFGLKLRKVGRDERRSRVGGAAQMLGLPGVLAHGMLTMGAAVQPVVDWAGPARILDYQVRFTRPVVVDPEAGAQLHVVATVGQLGEGTARIDLTVTAEGRTVLGKAQVVVATDR